MIREFIENVDTTNIPIGPQADLLELLEEVNGMLPSYLVKELGVTKKFNWKRGTYQKIKEIRDHLLGLDKPYKNVQEIFDKPQRNRRGYYIHRFERTVKNIDRMLMNKRWNGAVWLEDDDEINDIKQKAIEKAVKLFEEYDSYVNMIINKNIRYHIYDDRNGISEAEYIDNILNELYQFDDDRPLVLLDINAQRIMIMHPFKDIVMNTYNLDRTTPMFRFRCGNILGVHEISVKRLIYWAFETNYSRLRYGSIRSYFWYKPELKGLKHPFVHYPSTHRSGNNFDLEDWTIRYNNPSSTCYGNFNEIHSHNSVNIIKWCENVFNWLTTFRVGDTHPLNNIETGYYGSPLVHDKDVQGEYYDRIGTNVTSCHDRMSSYYENHSRRHDICMRYCDDDLRNTCHGFKWDKHTMMVDLITSWYKNTINKCHDKYYGDNPYGNEFLMDKQIYPGNFTLDFEHENIDDDYPMYNMPFVETDLDEQDMQKDMLVWVNSHTS